MITRKRQGHPEVWLRTLKICGVGGMEAGESTEAYSYPLALISRGEAEEGLAAVAGVRAKSVGTP